MVKSPSLKKVWLCYLAYQKRLLKNYKFVEKLKLLFSIFVFLLALGAYGYFVNVSSTKWYFIKVEREKLEEVKFQNEIVKIDVRKIEGDLSNFLVNTSKMDSLTWNIIKITDLKEVVYKWN